MKHPAGIRKRYSACLGAIAAALVGCSPPVTTASPPVPAAVQTTTVQALTPEQVNAAFSAGRATLPDRLSDADFWKLATDISEPGGYFQIENNYTSNEMEVGQLFTQLRTTGVSGDVFLGVGPEQNFTYIAAIRPRMAFIIDIRRQAAMQHLMFKAMFEMAADRADFISLLFAKPRPAGLDSATAIQKFWDAYRRVPTDSTLGNRNYARVVDRLTKSHGFSFTSDESEKLKGVFDAFYYYGPAIATRGTNTGGRGGDFAELTGYATDAAGQPRSFLSSEENYRTVKALHEKNLIVPITGDFGGPKAIRAIGSYLTGRHAVVRGFYVSNVEQYLFQDGHDRAFYANVATLPTDSASVFIRPYSMRRGGGGGPTQSLCPIGGMIRAALAGRVTSNNAALACVQ